MASCLIVSLTLSSFPFYVHFVSLQQHQTALRTLTPDTSSNFVSRTICWAIKVPPQSKFNVKVCHKKAFFSAYHKWQYLFRSLKWTLRPSKWKYWTWKCRFFASVITNSCSIEPTVWSCGLIIKSYFSLTCDVIFVVSVAKQLKSTLSSGSVCNSLFQAFR